MNQDFYCYRQIEVNTSNPLKLVLMLYDGAINFLKKSIEYAEKKDVKNKNIYANRARNIVVELNNYLNMEAGGEVAQNLKRLYLFMNRHLLLSNLDNNLQGLKEVIRLLSDLREAWQEVDRQRNGMGKGTNPFPDERQTEAMTKPRQGITI